LKAGKALRVPEDKIGIEMNGTWTRLTNEESFANFIVAPGASILSK